MKVLWLTNIPSPYRVDFFNELGKHCDLTVLFEKYSSSERDKSWQEFNTDHFNAIFLNGKSIGVAEAFCPSVVKWLKPEYDHIVVTNFSDMTGMLAILTLKAKKIPYEIESDGAFAGTGLGLKEKIKRFILSGAQRYFSTAEEHDKYYLTYGAIKDRIVRYPFTSIDEKSILDRIPEKNEKRVVRTKLGMSEDKIILSVGQFIKRKGFDILLHSCVNLNGVGVYIVGGVPSEEYLALVDELKLKNVHFVGFKSKDQLADYYKASDLFVLPTREDIWGLVVNEAMAYGLPVVTTNRCIAGLEMVKDNVNGKIVPTEDVKALSDAINFCLGSCDQFAKNSLETAKKYTIQKMVEVHLCEWMR